MSLRGVKWGNWVVAVLVWTGLAFGATDPTPAEIGQLNNLTTLALDDNPLKEPPMEIVEQGTDAVLAYLRGLEESETAQWMSKLIVVGEGGVGKTSLLRALRGEDSNAAQSGQAPTIWMSSML